MAPERQVGMPECVRKYAEELGTPADMVYFQDYREFTYPDKVTDEVKSRFGWRHESRPDGGAIVFMRNSLLNNGVVYTAVPAAQFSLFEKVMSHTNTLNELEAFLGIEERPSITA